MVHESRAANRTAQAPHCGHTSLPSETEPGQINPSGNVTLKNKDIKWWWLETDKMLLQLNVAHGV